MYTNYVWFIYHEKIVIACYCGIIILNSSQTLFNTLIGIIFPYRNLIFSVANMERYIQHITSYTLYLMLHATNSWWLCDVNNCIIQKIYVSTFTNLVVAPMCNIYSTTLKYQGKKCRRTNISYISKISHHIEHSIAYFSKVRKIHSFFLHLWPKKRFLEFELMFTIITAEQK